MKKSNLFLIIVMLVLVAVGWYTQVSTAAAADKEFAMHLQQADQYCESGLYQKAIQQFESALAIKEDNSTRERWLTTHEKAYAEGVIGLSTYTQALSKMCQLHPEKISYSEKLMQIYVDNNNRSAAYEFYMSCKENGIKSEIISELGEQILYSYRISNKVYSQFVRCSTGYYMVHDGRGWGIIRPDGDTVYDCKYEYIGPYNNGYQALFVTSKGQRIYDSNVVVEATVSEKFAKTGTYVDGIIPLCDEQGMWQYYDCATQKYISEKYTAASNFSNGMAAVCTGERWILIDKNMTAVSKISFSDIKLHSNGDYAYNGIMIASADGVYGIYDVKGNKKTEFSCKDADIYLGEQIAFQNEHGLWGYVDVSGNVVIEPQFENAKSFSNGLGAVCKDKLWGFAKTNGKIVIDPQFIDVDYFTSKKMCLVSSVSGQYYKIILRY